MSGPVLVRPEAAGILHEALAAHDRVAILGATGWFGSTALAMLEGHSADVLPIASRARPHRVGERTWNVHGWSADEVRAFDPTVILNFAYLTRDKERDLGPERYAEELASLNRRLADLGALPSVRALITVSSGAAILTPEGTDLPLGTYGEAKREEERVASALAKDGRTVVVARAYSLSGALVQRPHDYAFSDLILQARSGTIRVLARAEVWRRYCGVDDYIAVTAASALSGNSGVIESGGPDIEMRSLAHLVADRYPGERPLVESAEPSGTPLRYMSDDVDWTRACARVGFTPASLQDQVDMVSAAL